MLKPTWLCRPFRPFSIEDTQTGAFDPGRGCFSPAGPEPQYLVKLKNFCMEATLIVPPDRLAGLTEESDQLIRIITAIVKTAQNRK